jgi:glutamate-1-semialdehyde 2,1-aminomutase
VAELARGHGALLVFDETVTGFRLHLGGAQALTGVIPDLATFGKGLANGLPLSAVVGPRRLMALMEEIFFSTTFGGETLSLAAARATLDALEQDDVPARLCALGERLQRGLRALLDGQDLNDRFAVTGHPSWSFLRIAAATPADAGAIRTLLLQELFARGILTLGAHNLSAAHGAADIDRLLAAYEELLPRIHRLAAEGGLREALRTAPLEPLFKVR